MLISLILLLVSGLAGVLALSDPGLSSLTWPALIGLLAGGIGLMLCLRYRRRRLGSGRGGKPVVVDGSNVMHWRDNKPDVATVQAVIRHLKREGYLVGVVFDANAGYLLRGRHHNEDGLARLLGLDRDYVWVVKRGQIADAVILDFARKLDAQVVSNDRYRDWSKDYPEVQRPGWRLQGGFRDGKLWLEPAVVRG